MIGGPLYYFLLKVEHVVTKSRGVCVEKSKNKTGFM